ncbi:MAG TPA: TetR/AcrR family transcriptional regulator [Terriglobales bacterium]|nr:TetR/AcrR family transcriptional regulator [Terriglobales bacterium]
MKKAAEKSVTEVRIVEAAAQLFSRQGYRGASTREIAQLAGVNEATLFRYFARKAELFLAAAESRLTRLKLGRDLQNGLAMDLAPDIVVPMLVDFLVNVLAQNPELMRLAYVAGFELPEADRVFREHLGSIFDAVNAYFARCAARGAICNLEPTFATLGLAGAVSAHRNLHHLFTGRDLPSDVEALAPGYAQLWLNALRQLPSESTGNGSGRAAD